MKPARRCEEIPTTGNPSSNLRDLVGTMSHAGTLADVPMGSSDGKRETMVLATKKSSTSTRGFASMNRETQRAIAQKGGQSVPNEKRSFSQNRGLAVEAGRKGGQSVNPAKRSFSRNHALASEAGRKGGHASHAGQPTMK
jgi:uncharacterized protein